MAEAAAANGATAAEAAASAQTAANALVRLEKALKDRKALKGVPMNTSLNAIVTKARANAQRAKNAAAARKTAENAEAARVKAEAERAAREAEAARKQAERNARAAANAAAAKAAAEAKARAAAEKAVREQTAATAKAARNAAAAQRKAEANAAAAQQKAAANAAAAKAAAIRSFVLKLWPLTKGKKNGQTKLWKPRIQNDAELTRQVASLKGTLTAADIQNIKNNINRAAASKSIGYWGTWPVQTKNANLNNRISQVKWIVNLGLGGGQAPPAPWRAAEAQREAAAASKVAAVWKGRVTRQKLRNVAVRVVREARAAQLAAQPPVGGARSQSLFALPVLLAQWNKAPGGDNLKAKSNAITAARKSAPATGLGFRELHEFFSSHLNAPEADAATMAFYDYAPTMVKIGKKWVGRPAGTPPPGPKNNPGQIPKNDLVYYFKTIGEMTNANAAKAAGYYYNP